MKIHLSLETADIDTALAVAHQTESVIDTFYVSPLLILQYGVAAITRIKRAMPTKDIIADVKLADRAEEAVKACAQAGADWITVLSGTRPSIIRTACATARAHGKYIMLDLLDASSLGQSALEAQELGVHALLLPIRSEQADLTQVQDMWDMVAGNTSLPVIITGTMSLAPMLQELAVKPAALVLGKEIMVSEHPAQRLRSLVMHATTKAPQ